MKKNNGRKIYLISISLIIIAVIISIVIPLRVSKNEVSPVEIAKENNGLPKLENFEDLYNIVIKNRNEEKDKIRYMNDGDIKTEAQDAVEESTNIQDEEDYSTTNVQVENVDEADIVKSDGKYIYYISNKGVQIIGTEDGLYLARKIEFDEEDFNPDEIYIADNKLIVIGNNNNYLANGLLETDIVYPVSQSTIVKVYNTVRKSRPKLERQITIDGNYLSSRMIEDNVYVITNKNIYTYLFKDSIEEMNEEDYKPKYIDTLISDEEQLIDYKDIAYFPDSKDMSYLNIASFNINQSEKVNIDTYLGAGNNIYCSKDNLYIANVKYEYKDEKMYGYYNNYDLNTYIYKFKLDGAKVSYLNAGSVPGSILNQFSMDEKDGYLRIATTNSDSFNSETNVNNIYVLNPDLELVGKIENLAKGEKIYSVRFIGNRAYMVTFVQTDPLFVIDLSNNENPEVLGELKIPGYSNYLHPYDETHLIGFGENTKTNEDGGVVPDGMKMALFDVSNPLKPIEMFSCNIGDRGTSSEILYNHKALLFSKEKNIIAFPIYISEEEGTYKTNLKFQGAIVYSLDLENGFVEKGRISHKESQEKFDYDYEKAIDRIIYIKDSFYTLSKGLVKETNIEKMEELDSLKLK